MALMVDGEPIRAGDKIKYTDIHDSQVSRNVYTGTVQEILGQWGVMLKKGGLLHPEYILGKVEPKPRVRCTLTQKPLSLC